MIRLYSLLFTLICISCLSKLEKEVETTSTEKNNQAINTDFGLILDSLNLDGIVLIYDESKDLFISNDFKKAHEAHLPASTFKIPNSIIALETGIIEHAYNILPWDGITREIKAWNQDLSFKDAFKYSCVPCYQEIARKIGIKRMNEYLAKLQFGQMDVDSSNIDLFWLVGESKITAFEQIDFLQRLIDSELDISKQTEKVLRSMMLIEKTNNYTLRGKTGRSIRGDKTNAWFVGYLEKNNNHFFFATNISPKPNCDLSAFPKMNKEVTKKALQLYGLIN